MASPTNPPRNPGATTPACPYGDGAIADAAALIRAGQPVAVPTETVYGLAADARDSTAVARIYAAKGRPAFNPLIVHVADAAAARTIGIFGGREEALASAFWPGPLTIVVPLAPDAGIASLATAGLTTVALRVPAHRAMQALLRASGCPLAAPSANASGRISPTTAAHVAATLAGRIALIIDDGPTSAGLESTIVRVVGDRIAVLRPGPVTPAMLAAETGLPVDLVTDVESSAITAPGQLASHYAPAKPLRLDADAFAADEYGIGFGALAGDDNLSSSGDLIEAAARLFAALHAADASDRPRIAVARLPHGGPAADLGLAIHDRLRRAAA